MMSLLRPVIQDFNEVYTKLCQETDETKQHAYAECLNCAMSFARLVIYTECLNHRVNNVLLLSLWFELCHVLC